ncbi:oligopeptide/dipeptide ABC transporter ATP-binding protein [Acrocarpospora catenulata]|uniref:oligopeptide/dipeptide ABC transporter ATP-binding protein n=1 Tax=Acrocarpospora catenulata TaxID=2836182 RepID=UPI003556D0B8
MYRHPLHPYTYGLIGAIPEPDPDAPRPRRLLSGEPPSPLAPPSGCRFRTRCHRARELCAVQAPEIAEARPGHYVACHFPMTESGT